MTDYKNKYSKVCFEKVAKIAKEQGYALTKEYKDGSIGKLVYRGFFGDKHHFAYACIKNCIDLNQRVELYYVHLELKKYY